MEKFEEYLDRAKDLAEDAGNMAKHIAGEAACKARELTEEGSTVRELARNAKAQTAAVTLGAREKVNGILQDARIVKELKLAAAELETLPEDGSIIYKMDREAIINDMNKLTLFVTDSRLDDASAAEEIRKVMDKVRPSEISEEELPQKTDEELAIEKAKAVAYAACAKALEVLNGVADKENQEQ